MSCPLPTIFLTDPTEGLDLEDDPAALPIENFMPEDEREEWKQRLKELGYVEPPVE